MLAQLYYHSILIYSFYEARTQFSSHFISTVNHSLNYLILFHKLKFNI